MKKKSVFRKIAFLLTITLIVNLGVFDIFSFESHAETALTSNSDNVTLTNGTEYVVDRNVTIGGNLSSNYVIDTYGPTITVNSGCKLTINGNLEIHGTINNYGYIEIKQECNVYASDYNFFGRATTFNNYEGGTVKINNLIGDYEWQGPIGGDTPTHINNSGLVIAQNSSSSTFVENSNNGKLVCGNTYYNTSNLNLNVTITGTESQVVSGAYKNSATLTGPEGWYITRSTSVTPSSSIDITETTSGFTYYLYDQASLQGNHTQGKNYPAITIKTAAEDPTGAKYNLAGEKDTEGNFFWSTATLTPPTGYSEIKVTYADGETQSGSSINYSEDCIKGATVQLKDADNQWTQSYPLEDIYVLDGNGPYRVEGDKDIRDEGEDFPRYAQEAYIKAGAGYKVLLADDYNNQKATGTINGSNSIKVTSSIENPKIYVHSDNKDFWVGPITINPIHVGMNIPETKYTLKGNKYKDKYYDSDVVLTPAEGFKVTTSKDKAPTDKITFTKTTKDVKIYLAKEIKNSDHLPTGEYAFSDPISVGDIYILREGEGKVTVNDLFYGGRVIPVVSTKTNDIKKVSYKYKKAEGGDYLKETPSEVGKYIVEATFEMTDDYKELVVKDEFEISYLPAPATPYTLQGTLGDNNIYTTDVKILPADGYKISRTIKTGYVDSLELDKNADTGYVYLQKVSTGEMTDKIAIKEILIDKEEPVVTGIKDKEVIYTDSKQIIVKDDNLFEVTVNGVKVAVSNGQAVIDLSSDNGIMDYTIVMTDKAGHKSEIFVTLITAWMKEGNVQEGVPLKLYPGYTYNFPEGSTWTIEGDPTVYKGGNKFVVNNNVEIKFKKN